MDSRTDPIDPDELFELTQGDEMSKCLTNSQIKKAIAWHAAETPDYLDEEMQRFNNHVAKCKDNCRPRVLDPAIRLKAKRAGNN